MGASWAARSRTNCSADSFTRTNTTISDGREGRMEARGPPNRLEGSRRLRMSPRPGSRCDVNFSQFEMVRKLGNSDVQFDERQTLEIQTSRSRINREGSR